MIILKHFSQLTLVELYQILKLREMVFILEQLILAEAEIDDADYDANHYFIKDNEEIVAYMRLIRTNEGFKLGRICTKVGYRQQGLATQMIKLIQSQFPSVIISAQYQAKKFYEKLGFKPMSKKYKEAGIDHLKMVYIRG